MNSELRNRRIAKDERGVALVEFVLVLPLFMLLLLGLLEFGKVFNYWIDMTHLANEGARMAVVDKFPTSGPLPPACYDQLQKFIACQANTDELKSGVGPATNGGIAAGSADRLCISVSFPSTTSNAGDPVTVTARAKYQLVPFLGNQIGVPSITVKASATMRMEQNASRYSTGGWYASSASSINCPT